MSAAPGRTDHGHDDESVLAERARALAVVPEPEQGASELHLILRVAGHRVGVPASSCRHVRKPGPLATVPSAPTAIVGVAAVHGELVPTVDLATLLGVEGGEASTDHLLVVVDDGDDGLGLLVDDVETLTSVASPDGTAANHDGAPGAASGLTTSSGPDLRLLTLAALRADPRLNPLTADR